MQLQIAGEHPEQRNRHVAHQRPLDVADPADEPRE
jgi:hypothetical protein